MSGSVMCRRGYSLLELLVVLVLLALVAGGVLVSVKEPLRRARGQLAIDEWKGIDSQLRELAARTQRPVKLMIDGKHRTVERVSMDQHGRSVSQRLSLSGTWEGVMSHNHTVPQETWTVSFWPDGRAETYAVEIPDQNHRPQWLVLAGVTGQPMVLTDAATVQRILAQSRPIGDDAR